MTGQGGDWSRFAQDLPQLQPPRAPCAEDGAIMLDLARGVLDRGGPVRVLVLGVTTGIIQLPWPAGCDLIVVDANPAVIDAIWAPHPQVPSQVLLAGWDAMPLADGSIDLIVGDASFNALPSMQAYDAAVAECARVLAPGGKMVLRFFARRNPDRSPQQVVAEARCGCDKRLSLFRLDLAMALCNEDGLMEGSMVRRAFDQWVPYRPAFCARSGASMDEVERAIDRISANMTGIWLNYLTLEEIARRFAPQFVIEQVCEPGYERAELFPTLRLGRVPA